MNLAHIHLAICHVPVVGQIFACVGLAIAVFRNDLTLNRWILALAIFVGLSALPVTWSGEKAEDQISGMPEVSSEISMDLIDAHEEAAETAMTLTLVTAGIASLGIVASFLRPGVCRALTVLTLLAGLTASGFLAHAANLGGQIRHTEIRSPR